MERRDFLKIFIGGTSSLVSIFLSKHLFARASERKEEILFQNSPLAGFQYYHGERLWDNFNKGDPLTLIPEPGNSYDHKAVKVMYDGKQLGYIPRNENSIICGMLNRNQKITAKISVLNESGNLWERLEMNIYLIPDVA